MSSVMLWFGIGTADVVSVAWERVAGAPDDGVGRDGPRHRSLGPIDIAICALFQVLGRGWGASQAQKSVDRCGAEAPV